MKRYLLAVVLSMSSLPAFSASSCGGQLQPRCDVNAPVDQQMLDTASSAQTSITSGNDTLKASIDNIDPHKFDWTFIPQIPTAECVNPQIQSPIGGASKEMDICSPFNTFRTFINGVLAFFCILGCVQQVRAALAAK